MYKELATIKDGNKVTDFVVYDESSTMVIDINQAKKIAAAGDMDTLAYKDGCFIPIIQGKLADELKKKSLLKKYKKQIGSITFNDFTSADCLFRKQDVDLMRTNDDVVLANVCVALNLKVGNMSIWIMTMAFWSEHSQAMERIKEVLSSYAPYIKTIPKMKDYGNFIMLNLPLTDSKCNFDLLTFQQETGLNFVYNLEAVSNMNERINFMMKFVPLFIAKLINMMRPTSGALAGLIGVLGEADRMSAKSLSAKGVDYYY